LEEGGEGCNHNRYTQASKREKKCTFLYKQIGLNTRGMRGEGAGPGQLRPSAPGRMRIKLANYRLLSAPVDN